MKNLSTPCKLSQKKWTKGMPCRIIFTAKGHPVERHIPSGQGWEYPLTESFAPGLQDLRDFFDLRFWACLLPEIFRNEFEANLKGVIELMFCSLPSHGASFHHLVILVALKILSVIYPALICHSFLWTWWIFFKRPLSTIRNTNFIGFFLKRITQVCIQVLVPLAMIETSWIRYSPY